MLVRKRGLAAIAVIAIALALIPMAGAQAYTPTPKTLYQLPDNQPCLKGRGNCVIYAKTAQLDSGRLVASFEQATVPASGTAAGETLPVYKSDDSGTSWQLLSQVKAPAYLSSSASVAKYVSAWTNPYFYVLPQAVGSLAKGTLLMAAVVSGDDQYYKEQKAANPNWVPTADGDRSNMAIALYSSTDSGSNWSFQNIIATGGWSNGTVNDSGNTYHQQDPVWEPYLMVYNNQLVAYYSDENDYTGYNSSNGSLTVDPNNATATDQYSQVLDHRTWNGSASSAWSAPVLDVAGTTFNAGGSKTEIGGGRPGMPNVSKMADGKWLLTYEYFGGGDNVHYKIASNPLAFYSVGGAAGSNIGALPVTAGSSQLSTGGSPVTTTLPDGRVVFNAGASGSVWVNSGGSTAAWTQYQTTVTNGYSRSLTYDRNTGRVLIMTNGQTQGSIVYGDVDLGSSADTYYKIVNRRTGQVIGTGGNTTDANIGNGGVPDVRLEAGGSASNPATELWHITQKPAGGVALLNKSGGRSASIWTGNATAGQSIGQWVDDTTSGPFTMFTKPNGDVYFQSTRNRSLYLTGTTAGAGLTLQASDGGSGSQDWQLVAQSGAIPTYVSTWSAGEQDMGDAGFTGTVRNIVHTSVAGSSLRVKISNVFGNQTNTFSHVSVGLAGTSGAITGAVVPVTFSGSASVSLFPGAETESDPVALSVPAGSNLAVNVYVPTAQGEQTGPSYADQTSYVVGGADRTSDPSVTGYSTLTNWYYVTGVDVTPTSKSVTGTVVTLGDSITDGVNSTQDANNRYPDYLARRLLAQSSGATRGVANVGIGGNAILTDGAGPSALNRFQRDVLGQPGVKSVILLEGTNDIGGAGASSDSLIAADKQLIAQAHAAGVKIYGATIIPFKGSFYWDSTKEQTRQAVNSWIRSSGAFDGVFDFDSVMGSASDATQMNPAYDSGDHLHPNDAGYQTMANAVDLSKL